MTDTTASEGVMTEREVLDWIDACNHEPARNVLRRYLALAAQPSAGAQGERETYLRGSLDVVLRAVLDMARVGIEVAKQGEGYHTEERDRARIDFIREVCERWKATPAPPDTGDVAALREALTGDKGRKLALRLATEQIRPTTHEDACCCEQCMAHEVAIDTAKSAIAHVLAALSKPNAPGVS